jgi:hypothetical protein
VVGLALLLDVVVYLYTESDSLALVCATLVGVAAIWFLRHYSQGDN